MNNLFHRIRRGLYVTQEGERDKNLSVLISLFHHVTSGCAGVDDMFSKAKKAGNILV